MEAHIHSQLQEDLVDNRRGEYPGIEKHVGNACEFNRFDSTGVAEVDDDHPAACRPLHNC